MGDVIGDVVQKSQEQVERSESWTESLQNRNVWSTF